MASKITYWKCVDCNSMINDESMIFRDPLRDHNNDNDVVEYCYGCHSYNPEVVIAYA